MFADAREVSVRHYDARMVVPLTWDESSVSECAFAAWAMWRGRTVDLAFGVMIGEIDVGKVRVFSPGKGRGGAHAAVGVPREVVRGGRGDGEGERGGRCRAG